MLILWSSATNMLSVFRYSMSESFAKLADERKLNLSKLAMWVFHLFSTCEYKGKFSAITSIFQCCEQFCYFHIFQCIAIGKPLDETERKFYENTVHTLPRPLADYLSRYWGVIYLPQERNSFLVLEDVTSQFSRPSILDLKIGSLREYSEDMDKGRVAEKVQKSLQRTTHKMGIRVAGIKVRACDG